MRESFIVRTLESDFRASNRNWSLLRAMDNLEVADIEFAAAS
jgi:hypothetical protein